MAKIKSATKGGSKRDKPPALDQYKKPLIVVALAMLAYQLFKGMMAKEIVRVDMTATANELEIREVFFGEDASTGNTNYAVLCYPESAMYPISSVFQDAANDGSAPAEFRVMDCDVPMPGSEEGKTVIGRFKLSKKTRPVVFVSGAIGEPKQVRDNSLLQSFLQRVGRMFEFCSMTSRHGWRVEEPEMGAAKMTLRRKPGDVVLESLDKGNDIDAKIMALNRTFAITAS